MKYTRLIAFAGVLLILTFWEMACRGFAIPDFILPMPTQIIRVAISQASLLLPHAATTALEVVIGILISLAVAVPLCWLCGSVMVSPARC